MGRKRGELPTPAEVTVELGLKDGWVVTDIKHEKIYDKQHPKGMKRHFVKVVNTITGEKIGWTDKFKIKYKYGKGSDKTRQKTHKHTDETVAKQVQKLTNGNAELVSWELGSGANQYVKVKYKCGCIVERQLKTHLFTPDCPICSAKWRTEDVVCKMVEKISEELYDKDTILQAHRQHTVHMMVDGKEVHRRYDVAIELTHKFDKKIKRWVYIEYNGQQHYYPVNFGNLDEEELMRQFKGNIERDEQKKKYCEENNIPLIIIPYWKKDKIEEILKDELPTKILYESLECWKEYVVKYFM